MLVLWCFKGCQGQTSSSACMPTRLPSCLPYTQVAERSARQGVRIAGMALPTAVAGSKGRLGNLLRKAGAAVKQGSGALVASIKHAGASQQEDAVMG